jgi:histidyl-tRNA synthetase
MSNNIGALRGVKDLVPAEYAAHEYIINTAYDTAKLYGYKGFATPLLEAVEVFDRSLGESSDVISKEIYSFPDKKGRIIALRPEFTAGIMRAVFSNNLHQKLPLKLFSTGPLFRYDRPQEGRQRQFHQINFEYIGANGPETDAEILLLATHILKNLGLLEHVTLELNSLGCTDSRDAYQKSLIDYFTRYENDLSDDSKRRLRQNPLRILDSKDEKDRLISQGAPKISQSYSHEALEYFEQLQNYLNKLGVEYKINPHMVRGLDYYRHSIFEFTTTKLGAQSTILAGGRYDGLAKIMGGTDINSVGFAAGIERMALMLEYSPSYVRPVCLLTIGHETLPDAMMLAQILRQNNIATLVMSEGKIGKRLQQAVADNARYAVFIGEEEVTQKMYKVKDLDSASENIASIEQMVSLMKPDNN